MRIHISFLRVVSVNTSRELFISKYASVIVKGRQPYSWAVSDEVSSVEVEPRRSRLQTRRERRLRGSNHFLDLLETELVQSHSHLGAAQNVDESVSQFGSSTCGERAPLFVGELLHYSSVQRIQVLSWQEGVEIMTGGSWKRLQQFLPRLFYVVYRFRRFTSLLFGPLGSVFKHLSIQRNLAYKFDF